jgi:hypothetical protein
MIPPMSSRMAMDEEDDGKVERDEERGFNMAFSRIDRGDES